MLGRDARLVDKHQSNHFRPWGKSVHSATNRGCQAGLPSRVDRNLGPDWNLPSETIRLTAKDHNGLLRAGFQRRLGGPL